MLEVRALHVAYGDVQVLHDVDLDVAEGEIVAVLGANGAGKTTLLRCLSGLLPAHDGEVSFRGEPITNAPPHQIVGRGLVQVPEGRQLFGDLTVEENLRMGGFLPAARSHRQERMAWIFGLFPILEERRDQRAETMSGGEQQMLAIARGLMAIPKMLMLDEPSLGIAPVVLDDIFDTLGRIRDDGVTVVLVEQNAMQALELADRAYVLDKGRVRISGTTDQVMESEEVRQAYLGARTPVTASVGAAQAAEQSAPSGAAAIQPQPADWLSNEHRREERP